MEKICILSVNTKENGTTTKHFAGAFRTRKEAYNEGRDYIVQMSEGQLTDVEIHHFEEGRCALNVGAVFYFEEGHVCHTTAEFIWVDCVVIKDGTFENIKAAISLAADENFKAQYPKMWESAVEFLEHL